MSITNSSIFSERNLRTLRSIKAPSLPNNSPYFFRISRQWEATAFERRTLRQSFTVQSAPILSHFGYNLQSLELYAGVPFSAHPLFAHPAFNSLQAVFSGGTVQRLVILEPLEKSSSFSSAVSALLLLLNQILQPKKSRASRRPSPAIRSVFLSLPDLQNSKFRIFRVPGDSITKTLNSLLSSPRDEDLKVTTIVSMPQSAVTSSLAVVINLGVFSFLRVDFPLSFSIYKQRTRFSLAWWYSGRAGGLQIRCRAVRIRLGPSGDIAQLAERMLCKH